MFDNIKTTCFHAKTYRCAIHFQLQPCHRRTCSDLRGVCLILCSCQFCRLLGLRAGMQSKAPALGQRCSSLYLLAVYIRLGLGKSQDCKTFNCLKAYIVIPFYDLNNFSFFQGNYVIPALCCIFIFLAFGEDSYTSAANFPPTFLLLLLYG